MHIVHKLYVFLVSEILFASICIYEYTSRPVWSFEHIYQHCLWYLTTEKNTRAPTTL